MKNRENKVSSDIIGRVLLALKKSRPVGGGEIKEENIIRWALCPQDTHSLDIDSGIIVDSAANRELLSEFVTCMAFIADEVRLRIHGEEENIMFYVSRNIETLADFIEGIMTEEWLTKNREELNKWINGEIGNL